MNTCATMRRLQRDGRARSVALSSDGAVVVSGGFDNKVTLHRVFSGVRMQVYANQANQAFGDEIDSTRSMCHSVHICERAHLVAVCMEQQRQG